MILNFKNLFLGNNNSEIQLQQHKQYKLLRLYKHNTCF